MEYILCPAWWKPQGYVQGGLKAQDRFSIYVKEIPVRTDYLRHGWLRLVMALMPPLRLSAPGYLPQYSIRQISRQALQCCSSLSGLVDQ